MSWTQVDELESFSLETTPVVTPAERIEASEKPNAESMAVSKQPKFKKEKKLSSSSHDPVNSPSHYTSGGIETIDYMQAKLTPDEFIGYLKGNVIKYTSRAGKKIDMKEDYAKAQWYMNRLLKTLGDR
jgi:hypothetical protein